MPDASNTLITRVRARLDNRLPIASNDIRALLDAVSRPDTTETRPRKPASHRRRAECRSCGRDSALTQEELIQSHTAGGSRCPGSSRPAQGEEPCGFSCGGPMVGQVSYPADLMSADLSKPHASTYVCADLDHQAEATAWVKAKTGQPGVFVSREQIIRA